MAECKELVLVTLANMENDQINQRELARVATQIVDQVAHLFSLYLSLATPITKLTKSTYAY